jgi:hypothetical protein
MVCPLSESAVMTVRRVRANVFNFFISLEN